jgi:thiol:disulfide interchange protein/DsbC/DsbD-like thiol-disulfide interchange protein
MRLLLVLLALLAWPPEAEARDQHIRASLVASTEEPRPGSTVTIGVRFQPEAGWHGYWTNPGDSGLAPQVAWGAPPGIKFGPLRHPAPTILRVAGINSYVHAGEHVLLSSARIPASIAPGTRLPVKATLNWLACSDSLCVPERATVEIQLTAGNGAASSDAPVIRRAEGALPREITATGGYELNEGRLSLTFPAGISLNLRQARFFPDENGVLDASTARFTVADGKERLTVAASGNPSSIVSGVLSDGRRAYRVRFARIKSGTAEGLPIEEVPAFPSPPDEASTAASPLLPVELENAGAPIDNGQASATGHSSRPLSGLASISIAFLGALVGGLLLNLMPCVFPILSLKALSLARSTHSERNARREAVGYTIGALLGTGALGLAVVLLREAGVEVGWSFQLQNPLVILFLLLLTFGIALNLAGLFELPTLATDRRSTNVSMSASIGTGALAAFIATPCSGPFMAAALGAAMLLPVAGAVLIFLGLGMGLALPFLIIAFFPAARRFLPKPGPWMATFRRVLAVPMLVTAVALLWLLGRQAGPQAMTIAVVLSMLLGVGFWWMGRRQHGGRSRSWLPLAPATLAAALITFAVPPTTLAASAPTHERVNGTEPFSESRLAELQRAGIPVFVDFTADWCLTCKVNERVAIDREATQAAFGRAGVVTLEGDWTKGDPAITRFLSRNGRNSIPFYLFVRPGQPPEVLPQLLTPTMLIKRAEKSAS